MTTRDLVDFENAINIFIIWREWLRESLTDDCLFMMWKVIVTLTIINGTLITSPTSGIVRLFSRVVVRSCFCCWFFAQFCEFGKIHKAPLSIN